MEMVLMACSSYSSFCNHSDSSNAITNISCAEMNGNVEASDHGTKKSSSM